MIFLDEYRFELEEYVKENKKTFENLSGKTILISGAAGLIGSYLIDLCIIANQLYNLGVKIYALDRNNELLEKRFPSQYNEIVIKLPVDVVCDDFDISFADYVIHAASNTSPTDYATKPIDTIKTNVIGTDKLINLCINKRVKRFIFCSSVEVYGQNNGDVDEFDEEYSGYVNSNTVRAGYPSAKRVAEALCNAYMEENSSFDFVIARIGRIYGPTVVSGDAKAPSQFIANAVNGEKIVMKSEGLQEFSYAYVADCAMAIIFIMLFGKCAEAYNIADRNSRILLKQFAQSAAIAGGTEVVFCLPNENEKKGYSKVTKAVMNTDKIEALGWRAKYNVESGVLRTVEYLKKLKEG